MVTSRLSRISVLVSAILAGVALAAPPVAVGMPDQDRVVHRSRAGWQRLRSIDTAPHANEVSDPVSTPSTEVVVTSVPQESTKGSRGGRHTVWAAPPSLHAPDSAAYAAAPPRTAYSAPLAIHTPGRAPPSA